MERYIVAIDQSTSATKVFLMDTRGAFQRRFSKRHHQAYPLPGRAEHDAEEIWQNAREGVQTVIDGLSPGQIAAIAICNQRETTVLWDRKTGLPVCPAIVWQDVRGAALCRELEAHREDVRRATGLALSPYYSAAKAACALRENARRVCGIDVCVGTVDSYLIYRMTGGKVFATDASNASRTQLMNLRARAWDDSVCRLFGISTECLPRILDSDGDFGATACEGLPLGIPIAGVMGDSHASLFGHGCTCPGMTKTSYGTGSSVMMNAGETPPDAPEGLSSSVGYARGGKTHYVLEGNITCSGDTITWLCEQAQMAKDASDAQKIAETVPDTQGVYLVPAFSGLGAPYFDEAARAAIVGMNRGTSRAHIVRAALESMAYQNADVIYAMEKALGRPLSQLRADGGGSQNALLMQFQADLLGCEVLVAPQSETSAYGVGRMAGLATGLFSENTPEAAPAARYAPNTSREARDARMNGWRRAVNRARG